MLADVAAAANVRQITELDCKTTNDGEPGYLCWFKSPQINSYAASIRVQKGWLGWKDRWQLTPLFATPSDLTHQHRLFNAHLFTSHFIGFYNLHRFRDLGE